MKVKIYSSDGRTLKGEHDVELDEGNPIAQIEGLIDAHVGDVLEFVPNRGLNGIDYYAPDTADYVPYMGLSRKTYPKCKA